MAVMIDLETLDTDATCVILSIGACVFDPMTGIITDELYMEINKDAQIKEGRTISASTLDWWMTQPAEERDRVLVDNSSKLELYQALANLANFVPKGDKVWANGIDFDLRILEHAYTSMSIEVPWRFYNTEHVRTICNLTDGFISRKDFEFEGQQHNALHDARHQVKYVSVMYGHIRNSLAIAKIQSINN